MHADPGGDAQGASCTGLMIDGLTGNRIPSLYLFGHARKSDALKSVQGVYRKVGIDEAPGRL
jgi:hypothetical protein